VTQLAQTLRNRERGAVLRDVEASHVFWMRVLTQRITVVRDAS
jgi:hypothetical protein